MERDDLVERLNATAADLRSLFHGKFGAWFDRVVLEQLTLDPGERPLEADRLYEILCFLTLVRHLRCDRLELRTPGTNFRLPYGPAKKGNFAFFRVQVDGREYDLCNGTSVDVDDDSIPDEHPDISFQATRTSGGAGELVAIWDAKYTSRGRLGKDALAQMTYWFNALRVSRPAVGDVLSRVCPESFGVSAIVTNAEPAKFNTKVQKQLGFGCVFQFDGSRVDSSSVPSRSDIVGSP